jgi:serine/threonine-protein phosphatase 2A regulatory subunit B
VWRISEREATEVTTLSSPVTSMGSSGSSSSSGAAWGGLTLPGIRRRGSVIQATPRRIFSNAHAYHINSISLNSDEETFLSSDDLRVNMWNLNVGGDGFNILDIKPENMEELTEVITAAEFHPQHCHLFMHSSSRGVTKVCDLRQSALCQTWAKEYDAVGSEAPSPNSFFSEIIASVSDIQFSPDGRYILTRDYMNLRLWDMNMERAPVLVVPVHEHLRGRLCDLYENDYIFDKFQCSFSHDGGSLLTGSYNSLFQSYSAHDGDGAAVEATVDFISGMSGRDRRESLNPANFGATVGSELIDPSRRILHLDSSPISPIAAVAAGPALYLYFGDELTGAGTAAGL